MNFRQYVKRLIDILYKGYYLEKYIIRDGKTHPVAIICPGGGYHWVCSSMEGMPYAWELNRLGYSAFVVRYRCGKGKEYPVPQNDLAGAIGEIMANANKWNLDMDGYSLWGSSAGGHLAASFGTDAMGYKNYKLPKPAAIILAYPVITMGEKTHPGSRDFLLGKDQSPQRIELASIEKQITPDYPPTFVWCGLADKSVDPENSRLMADALAEKGVSHIYLPVEGVDHGVGVGKGLLCEGWLEKAVGFWEECS